MDLIMIAVVCMVGLYIILRIYDWLRHSEGAGGSIFNIILMIIRRFGFWLLLLFIIYRFGKWVGWF